MAASLIQQRLVLAAAAAIFSLLSSLSAAEWTVGRATWFDVGPDMSKANCHYSWSPTGRDVGAFPDVQDGFASSCGKCFEIRCRNADLTDGYGKALQRSNACYDENKSIVITIVDACPCRYPNNDYSNKRWCCGDMNHIDISQEAFQKLADLSKGVIGLSYREVDCGTRGAAGGNGGTSNSNGNKQSGGGSAGGGNNNNGNGGGRNSQQQQQPQQPSLGGDWWSGQWGV